MPLQRSAAIGPLVIEFPPPARLPDRDPCGTLLFTCPPTSPRIVRLVKLLTTNDSAAYAAASCETRGGEKDGLDQGFTNAWSRRLTDVPVDLDTGAADKALNGLEACISHHVLQTASLLV